MTKVVIIKGDIMSKTKILFDLITYVNTKRIFTAQDVANEFNISVRTAHRYLLDLSEMGIPLYTESGRNGGYRILHDRVLPPVIFDENEAYSIFFAFQALKYYKSLPFEVNIDSVSRKLYANLPDDAKKKIDRLDTALLFWNKKRNLPFNFLKDAINASVENQIIKIEYLSKDKNTIKYISPIGVYAYDGLWYMPAYDVEISEIRLYRVDRILSLEYTGKYASTKISLESWLENNTKQSSCDPIRLNVELTREGMRKCSDQPWLENHVIKINEEHGYIDTFIGNNELGYVSNYLFQLGTSAKVLEPQEIINNICKLSQDIINQYNESN